MNIFLAGGEDTTFAVNSGVSVSTVSGFISGFARSSVQMGYNATQSLTSQSFANSNATLWIHFMAQISSIGGGSTGFYFYDTAGHFVEMYFGNGTVTLLKGTNGVTTGTVSVSSNGITTVSSPQPIDIYMNYGSSGQLSVYQNGTLVYDTGPNTNLTVSGYTTICSFGFGTIGNSQVSMWVSEVIVADTSTLGLRVATLAPAAAGNTQSWTPSTLANINKTSINDTTSIGTTLAASLSEWTTSSLSITGSYNVVAMVEEARVEVGATGPQHFSWVTRTGSTDYSQGTVTATTGFTNYNGGPKGGVWYSNPFSGASWALSDFNNVGFNIGIESQT